MAAFEPRRLFSLLPAPLLSFELVAQTSGMPDDGVILGPARSPGLIYDDGRFWDRDYRLTSRRSGTAICRTQREEAAQQEARR